MTINEGCKIVFANESSDKFGVGLCDIGTINTDSNDEESQLITSTTAFKDTWDLHSVQKSSPLQFKITIYKINGTFITAFDEEILKEWLCRDTYQMLQIDQKDMRNIFYKCIIINPQKINAGKYSGGMQFSVICDSGHAWSKLNSKSYSTVSGTLSLNLPNNAKYTNYVLRPTVIITPSINGNISIKNNTTGKVVTVNNCVITEVITLDGLNGKIKSSNGRNLIDVWNKQFLTIGIGMNNITLTGNFTVRFEYRHPVRVGG